MKEKLKIVLALITLCLLVGVMAYYGNVWVRDDKKNYHPFYFLLIDFFYIMCYNKFIEYVLIVKGILQFPPKE